MASLSSGVAKKCSGHRDTKFRKFSSFFEVLEYIWNKHIPQVNRVHVEGACTMHRIDDMPLVLQYQAANLGIIRYCIASLEEHNRNNAKTICIKLYNLGLRGTREYTTSTVISVV